MKNLEKIVTNIKKYFYNQSYKARFIYTKFYEKLKIKDNEILFQSYDGSSISGNVYYILLELCQSEEYQNYKKYIVANKKNYDKIKKYLDKKSLSNIKIIIIHSRKYCRKLAEAKYLINNSTFPTYFIKKERQIYLNTWHGTPLKAMGRNIKHSQNELGNAQRNLLMADYLIYPNQFTFEHMRNDYMLDNLYKGKYIITGYPRNTAFYNEDLKSKIRNKLKLENKKVIVYMPTWRGAIDNKSNNKQFVYVMHTLYELDSKMDKNTVLYVKFHNYNKKKIDYSEFKNIKPFPKNYETYEFLNVADCLITDYSSVLFDYANTRKKIILYAYDKDEYLNERGMYLEYDKLPFNIVKDIDSLSKEINSIDKYESYNEFINEYNKYDNENAVKELCEYIFNNKQSNDLRVINGEEFCNKKKNILIFGGTLYKNGITTALKGLIKNIDKEKRNYFITFYKNKVEKNKESINDFSQIGYIPIQGKKDMTIAESICQYLYFNLNITNYFVNKKLERLYKREIKRVFPNLKFDYVIHYSGYEPHIMHLFKYMNAEKIIYLHSNMEKEIEVKKNIHEKSFKEVLDNYDKIVVIRETAKDDIIDYYPKIKKEKIMLAHNLNNIDDIIEKSKRNIVFDPDTYCNISIQKLNEILNDKNVYKFINIARFSTEKGQDRLIHAFQKFREKYKNAYLIIIGGKGGGKYKEIKNMALNSENVIIIKSTTNPYPILKKSDLFILTSYYEGLPMTIMEALILEKPVISTDITGPREFLQQGYGYLVENSEEGIFNGMISYVEEKLGNLKKFDAITFNKKAIEEFENLFTK